MAPPAMILVTLALGFLFPWEPPSTRDAPQNAVLRVVAPEGKPYSIMWNFDVWEVGEVEGSLPYRDYEVPPEAGSPEEGFNLALARVEDETGEKWDGPLRGILFVEGEYATCSDSGVPFLRLYWRSERGPGNPFVRAICGEYRFSTEAPSE